MGGMSKNRGPGDRQQRILGPDVQGQETTRLSESLLNLGSDIHLHPFGQNSHTAKRVGLGDVHFHPVSTGKPGTRDPADLTATKCHLNGARRYMSGHTRAKRTSAPNPFWVH